MSEVLTAQKASEGIWKKTFLILSIAIIVIMPMLSSQYGQSGDEWLEIEYGRDIYNYFFNGDRQAVNYENKSLQYQGMEYYGGFFDYYTEVLHHVFPSVPLLTLKHFCNALVGAILMIFTGLLARRLSKKWTIGVLALVFMIFSPRIFGESMNNPKDIPHACGFIIGIYGLVALLQDVNIPKRIWRNALILCIGFAMTFGSRPAGGLLQACYFILFIGLYYILNKEFKGTLLADNSKKLKQFIIGLAAALIVGYIIGMSAWPWGLQDPIGNTMLSLKEMTNRGIVIPVLFEGNYTPNNNMPWYYEFKWICMTSPIIVIIGAALFLLLVLKLSKMYNTFLIILLPFAAFFPLLYMIYKHSSVHDTWRHVFFVYPYWVIMAAFAYDAIGDFVKNPKLKLLPYGIALLGLLPTIIWTFKSHPNQYVYFNQFVGGVKGAFGYYDLDYYMNTSKQAANWILENAEKPPKGEKIFVRSNMLGWDKYFEKDTSWIVHDYGRYNERYMKEWDYYVSNPRYLPAEQLQNGSWPPSNATHIIEVDGVPLCAIIKRKSTAGIEAYKALEANDIDRAIAKYEEYLNVVDGDEYAWFVYGRILMAYGEMDKAIAALTKATQINPAQPEFFKILGDAYKAKGDMMNAQKAYNRVGQIQMQQQEAQG